MRVLTIFASAFIALSSFAADVQVTCKARPESKTNSNLLDTETVQVRINGTKIAIKRTPCNENEVAGGCTLTGTFSKISKDGSYMYDSTDLLDVADQTDYAYIFVSPKLMNKKAGTIAFSVRQLGDSEGAWWMTETFDCKVKE